MIDSLLLNGILAGIGISLLAGPLGCFIIWRRMAYFGDTVAHSSLLGVSLAILLDVNLIIGVFTIAVCIALLLTYLQRQQTLSSDSLLGILSHGFSCNWISLFILYFARAESSYGVSFW